MRRRSVSLALVLGWLALWAPGLPGQTRASLRELLPEGTLAYLESKDLPALARAAVRRAPLFALLQDPEVQAFLEPLNALLRDAEGQLAATLGSRPIELGNVLEGPAAVALVDRPGPEGPPMPDVVLALGIKPGAATVPRLLDHLGRRAVELDDVAFRTVDLAGRAVRVFDWNGRFEVCACAARATLFVTSGRAVMKGILERLEGSANAAAGSLAASRRFQVATGHAHAAAAHAFLYLDLASIRGALDRVFGRGYPEYDLVTRVLDLGKIESAAWSLRVTDTGFRERAYVGGKGKAIRALLGQPSRGAPRQVPADVLLHVGYRVNWEALHASLRDALEGAARSLQSERAAEWLGQLRLLEDGAFGFGLREDVVGALGPELSLAVTIPRGSWIPRIVAEVEVLEPSRLERVLGRLRELSPWGDVRLTVVAHGAHRLHVVRIPGRTILPTFVLHGRRLVMGSTPSVVKKWLRPPPASLADDRGYRRALTSAGLEESSRGYSVTYLDVPRLVAFILDNRSLLFGKHGRWRIPFASGSVPLDMDRFPTTAALRTPLAPLLVATRPFGDGLVMDAASPVPLLGGLFFCLEGVLFTGTTRFVRPPGEMGVYVDDQHAGAGCRIAGVIPGSPAAAAGLETGDIIVRINDEAVTNADQAVARLNGLAARQTVRLGVVRRAEPERAIDVRLGVRRED